MGTLLAKVFVEGKPAPGGSKKAVFNKALKRTVLVDMGKGNKGWREVVAYEVFGACGKPLFCGPLELKLTFWLERPRSAADRDYPTVRPDVLKLSRAVEDALTGILFVDDAQIVNEHIFKRYSDPGGKRGVEISLYTVEGLSV